MNLFKVSACGLLLVLLTNCRHHPPDFLPVDLLPVVNPPVTGIPCDPDTVYFVNDILPILVNNCNGAGCHNADDHADGVALNNYANVFYTGDIRPGDPQGSDLYERITAPINDKPMPPLPAARLSNEQITKIRNWILQGGLNNRCTSGCDSTDYTYSGKISTVIQDNCSGCHFVQVPTIVNYQDLKNQVDNGKLWKAINHLPGAYAMPNTSTFLSDCNIRLIKKWIDDGAPNN